MRSWLFTGFYLGLLVVVCFVGCQAKGDTLDDKIAALKAKRQDKHDPAGDPFKPGNAAKKDCGCTGPGDCTCGTGCTCAACAARKADARAYRVVTVYAGPGMGVYYVVSNKDFPLATDSRRYATDIAAQAEADRLNGVGPKVGDQKVTDDPARPWVYGYGREYGWNELGWYRPAIAQAVPGTAISSAYGYYGTFSPGRVYASPGACAGGS